MRRDVEQMFSSSTNIYINQFHNSTLSYRVGWVMECEFTGGVVWICLNWNEVGLKLGHW